MSSQEQLNPRLHESRTRYIVSTRMSIVKINRGLSAQHLSLDVLDRRNDVDDLAQKWWLDDDHHDIFFLDIPLSSVVIVLDVGYFSFVHSFICPMSFNRSYNF